MRGIVNHGMYKRYYHDEVGVNSRLDSVQAAVLKENFRFWILIMLQEKVLRRLL